MNRFLVGAYAEVTSEQHAEIYDHFVEMIKPLTDLRNVAVTSTLLEEEGDVEIIPEGPEEGIDEVIEILTKLPAWMSEDGAKMVIDQIHAAGIRFRKIDS